MAHILRSKTNHLPGTFSCILKKQEFLSDKNYQGKKMLSYMGRKMTLVHEVRTSFDVMTSVFEIYETCLKVS